MRMLLATAVAALVWAAPAGAQSIQITQLNMLGCANTVTRFSLAVAGLDGSASPYSIRTLVRAGGLAYMNENATGITANTTFSWGLYSSFTYGTTPDQAPFPLAENEQVRVDLTLERPMATILSAWTVVLSRCNGGAMLYNGSTATLPLRLRTLGLNYDRAGGKFIGWLVAKGAAALHSRRLVTIWKVRPGADLRVGQARTTSRGNFSLRRQRRAGLYYAVAAAIIQPPVGHALRETSLNLRLR